MSISLRTSTSSAVPRTPPYRPNMTRAALITRLYREIADARIHERPYLHILTRIRWLEDLPPVRPRAGKPARNAHAPRPHPAPRSRV